MSNFELLDIDEMNNVNGGLVGGAILGAMNGFSVGLVVALVSACAADSWSYENTKDVVVSCTISGACLGAAFIPA